MNFARPPIPSSSIAEDRHADEAEEGACSIAADPRKIVAVLSPFEQCHFFPDGFAKTAADRGLPDVQVVPIVGDWSWAEFLSEARPDVIIGGWDMPPLPAECSEIPPARWPRYLCFLTGTVRKKVPRCWIEHGLLVTNWGNSISRIVAESALMMILGALRCVAANQHNLHHARGWKLAGRPEQSLFGRVVGLHGLGHVAQALAHLLRPFGVALRTWAPGTPEAVLCEHNVHVCRSVEELFATSDVLVEAAPLNESTRGIVGRELLSLLPEGAAFINIGRGQVVREAELLEVALARNLRVALDVFEYEPLAPDSPLRSHPQILLMPHQAGPTLDRCRDAGEFALRQVAVWLRGELPPFRITPRVWDEST